MTPEEKLTSALRAHAASKGMELNCDAEHLRGLISGLTVNEMRYGYRCCPCRLAKNDREADRDIVCPCAYRDADVAEFGSCYCGLYVTPKWNMGEAEHVYVPERRPMEKRFL